MKTTLLATTGLAAAIALSLSVHAQSMPGTAMPGEAPRSTEPADVLRHGRVEAGPTAQPVRDSASRMAQAARRADGADAGREPQLLLDEAQRALDSGNWPLATELVERAQTAMLNRHVGPSGPGGGQDAEALRATSAATAALSTRNRGQAQDALRTARNAAARLSDLAMTGADASIGGAAAGGPGTSMPAPAMTPPASAPGATPQPGMGASGGWGMQGTPGTLR
jgi:hypothetical protein